MSLSDIFTLCDNSTTKSLLATESTSIPIQHHSDPSTTHTQHQAVLKSEPSPSTMVSFTPEASLSNASIALGNEMTTSPTSTSNQFHSRIAIEHHSVFDPEPPPSSLSHFNVYMITDLPKTTTSTTTSPPISSPTPNVLSLIGSTCEEDTRPAPPVDKRRHVILDTGCSLFMFANTLESCDNIISTRRTINGIGGTLIATQQGELMGGEVIKTPSYSNNVNVFGTGNWAALCKGRGSFEHNNLTGYLKFDDKIILTAHVHKDNLMYVTMTDLIRSLKSIQKNLDHDPMICMVNINTSSSNETSDDDSEEEEISTSTNNGANDTSSNVLRRSTRVSRPPAHLGEFDTTTRVRNSMPNTNDETSVNNTPANNTVTNNTSIINDIEIDINNEIESENSITINQPVQNMEDQSGQNMENHQPIQNMENQNMENQNIIENQNILENDEQYIKFNNDDYLFENAINGNETITDKVKNDMAVDSIDDIVSPNNISNSHNIDQIQSNNKPVVELPNSDRLDNAVRRGEIEMNELELLVDIKGLHTTSIPEFMTREDFKRAMLAYRFSLTFGSNNASAVKATIESTRTPLPFNYKDYCNARILMGSIVENITNMRSQNKSRHVTLKEKQPLAVIYFDPIDIAGTGNTKIKGLMLIDAATKFALLQTYHGNSQEDICKALDAAHKSLKLSARRLIGNHKAPMAVMEFKSDKDIQINPNAQCYKDTFSEANPPTKICNGQANQHCPPVEGYIGWFNDKLARILEAAVVYYPPFIVKHLATAICEMNNFVVRHGQKESPAAQFTGIESDVGNMIHIPVGSLVLYKRSNHDRLRNNDNPNGASKGRSRTYMGLALGMMDEQPYMRRILSFKNNSYVGNDNCITHTKDMIMIPMLPEFFPTSFSKIPKYPGQLRQWQLVFDLTAQELDDVVKLKDKTNDTVARRDATAGINNSGENNINGELHDNNGLGGVVNNPNTNPTANPNSNPNTNPNEINNNTMNHEVNMLGGGLSTIEITKEDVRQIFLTTSQDITNGCDRNELDQFYHKCSSDEEIRTEINNVLLTQENIINSMDPKESLGSEMKYWSSMIERNESIIAADHIRDQHLSDHVYLTSAPMSKREAMKQNSKFLVNAALAAIDKELEGLENNNVIEYVDYEDIPIDKRDKILRTFTFVVNKYKPNGDPDKSKGRCVILGNNQHFSTYGRCASPVINRSLLNLMLQFSTEKGFKRKTIDIASAFCKTVMKDKDAIYVELDRDIRNNDESKRYGVLLKCLYGLRQASREYFVEMRKSLIDFGLEPSTLCGGSLSLKRDMILAMLVALYVDDLLLVYKNEEDVDKLIAALRNRWGDITIGDGTSFCGLSITDVDDKVYVSQTGFQKTVGDTIDIEKDIEKYYKKSWRDAPWGSEGYPALSQSTVDFTDIKRYQCAIGLLLWCCQTRYDLMPMVGLLASCQVNPKEDDWVRVVRLLWYVRKTYQVGLIFKPIERINGKIVLTASVDSSLQANRGHTGFSLALGFNATPFLCSSKRQKVLSKSSCEAEFYGYNEVCTVVMYVRQVLRYVYGMQDLPITFIECDNNSAIKATHGECITSNLGHVSVKAYYARQCFQMNEVIFIHTRTNRLLADFLTKCTSGELFERNMRRLLGFADEKDHGRIVTLHDKIKIRIGEVDDSEYEAEKKGQISNSKRSEWRKIESETVVKN